ETILESRLGRPVRVVLISHAAMLPEDLYHYSNRIKALHPDIVVYPVVSVDLDLERMNPPYLPGPSYRSDAHFAFLKNRVPAQRFYPAAFALEHRDRLTAEELSSGFLRGLMSGLRYANQWWDVLAFNRAAESGQPLKSYVYYQGQPLAGGLYRSGRTSGCIAFPREYASDGLDFEIPPELYGPDFRIELEWISPDSQLAAFDSNPLFSMWQPHWKGKVDAATIEDTGLRAGLEYRDPCNSHSRILDSQTLQFSGPGWKHVNTKSDNRHTWLRIRLSHVMYDGQRQVADPSNRLYGEGIRMPGQFGLKSAPENQVQHRRWFLEDQRLLHLNDGDYIKDYSRRISPDDWRKHPALVAFNELRISRSYLPWKKFEPIYEMRRMEDLRAIFQDRLLLIYNPENPVELPLYSDSQYLDDFLSYLSRTQSRGFVDFHNDVPMQYFADPHHLSYFGMLAMAPKYARAIEDHLRKTVLVN
ncbi:MAG: hypothetical protein KDK37_08465, partial [Leptospiraceae bacterium]|nr:hypothetical protein [Leptospiraceae bacterium]